MKLFFPNGEHGEVMVKAGTISIGRAPGNEVLLDFDDIADQHARLVEEALGLVICPVGTADVYINGRRVTDRAPVRAGDVLGLHKIQIRVQPTDASERQEAVASPSPADEATKVRPALQNYYLRGVSGDTFGRVFPLSARSVAGRGEDCEIVLDAEEISRSHAALEVTTDSVRVTDLGSSNGTFVNGERLHTAEVRELKRNDEIAFDTLRFRLESTSGRGKAPRPASAPKANPAPARKKRRAWLWTLGIAIGAALIACVAWWLLVV